MTDDLVDTRTDTSREFVVTERTRVRISFDALFVNDLVDFEGRDSRSNSCSCDIQDFSSELLLQEMVNKTIQGHQWKRFSEDSLGKLSSFLRFLQHSGPFHFVHFGSRSVQRTKHRSLLDRN